MTTPTHHDASKTMLGTTESSDRVVSNYPSDPADFPSGVAVRQKNTGGLSLSSGDGALVGVSLGRSLSDTKKTAVCRAGNRVPLSLTDEGDFSTLTLGDLTFTAKAKGEDGDDITITLLDDVSEGAETVEVTGTDIVVHMEDGASTAQEISDALEASDDAMALIGVAIDPGEEATAQADAAETPLAGGVDSYPYVVKGEPVLTDNTTGLAVSSGGTTTGAVYVDGPKTGVRADASEQMVAIIDMGGGL